MDRAAQLLADVLGASVATGTLAAVVAEGAAGLGGFAQVVREGLAAAPVAHFDETGARVAGRLHWVHSASTSLLSLFTVHAKRGKVAMDAAGVLGGFAGVAVHDGWAPYWRYDVTHALCGAHLLRELEGVADEPGQGWAAGMAELLVDAKLACDRARAAGADRVEGAVRAGCAPATGGCSRTGRRPTRPHRPSVGGEDALAARPPPGCWSGWMPTGTRSCAAGRHPRALRQQPGRTGPADGQAAAEDLRAADAPRPARRRSWPCAAMSRPPVSTA